LPKKKEKNDTKASRDTGRESHGKHIAYQGGLWTLCMRKIKMLCHLISYEENNIYIKS
jgi:hypothetical protein